MLDQVEQLPGAIAPGDLKTREPVGGANAVVGQFAMELARGRR